jgi:pimeloyl-ACP methyl ester carboxylesterase
MTAVVDAVVSAGTSTTSSKANPLAQAAVRLSLLSQDPEGYAKACTALAEASQTTLPLDEVRCGTLIVTGEEDKASPPANCAALAASLPDCHDAIVLPKVGHWHIFEDAPGVADVVGKFLGLA